MIDIVERRIGTDIDHAGIGNAVHDGIAGIDAGLGQQIFTAVIDIGRRKAHAGAPVLAMDDLSFNIEGKVIHGKHRGTGMGFPTANVDYSSEYLLPKTGVYAGYAIVDGISYPCMINIGTNPTFHDIDHMSLEAYLLHFHGDLYDKRIRLEFLKYIRAEKAFRSRENLILQMEQDLRDVESYLSKANG